MRRNLTTKHFTRAERVFGELLKQLRIPYQAKVSVGGREADFVVGNYAIEIDAHPQASDKNVLLLAHGFTPIHFTNADVLNNRQSIITWLEQTFSHQ